LNGHADLLLEAGIGRDISDLETPIISHLFYSLSSLSLDTKGNISNGILLAPRSALVSRGICNIGPIINKAPLKRQRLIFSSSILLLGSIFKISVCLKPLSSLIILLSSILSPLIIYGSSFNIRDSFYLKDKLNMLN
jgi:hypothetical protein